jgi:hypothetical protein
MIVVCVVFSLVCGFLSWVFDFNKEKELQRTFALVAAGHLLAAVLFTIGRMVGR